MTREIGGFVGQRAWRGDCGVVEREAVAVLAAF